MELMGRRPHPLGSELHQEGCCEVQEEKHTAQLAGQNDAKNAPANRQNVEASSAREELGGVKNLQPNDAHSIPEPTQTAARMLSKNDSCISHLCDTALELGQLALHVHRGPVLRLQAVRIAHLPSHAHAVEDCQTCMQAWAIPGSI